MEKQETLLKGLSKFVEERNIKKVRLIFNEFHSSDVYKEIEDWPIEKVVLFLRLLKEEDASDLFTEMTPKQQTEVVETLTTEEISDIFEEMYTDEAVDILEDLPEKITSRILKAANSATREKINRILRYDKNSVGYHMVVDFVSVSNSLTIKEAKSSIKKQINKDGLEIVGNIFVFDKKTHAFLGYIQPDDIFAGENEEKIDKYIEKIKPLITSEHIFKAQKAMSKYDILSMPVLNSKNQIVGVVEAEDIIEKYEEVGEAAFEQAAMKSTGKPYLESKIFDIFKSRIPWLISLLIIGTFSQIVIMAFETLWAHEDIFSSITYGVDVITLTNIATLSVTTALSITSSITDTAGNAGSQTSSTLVRAIALGEIGSKGTYSHAIKKEFVVSLMIGFAIFLVSFLRILLVWACFGYFNSGTTSIIVCYLMLIAFVSSFTFFLTIVIGNLIGTILPLLAHKFGIDGAIFSGPVQTTIIDLITIVVYFSITSIIFIPIQHQFHHTSLIKIAETFQRQFLIMLH